MAQTFAPSESHVAVPLLETKLRRPTGTSFQVARPRLFQQLAASADRRLILISAPAGYGKTALVSGWLAACGTPYAWLSLDEHDDDLESFLVYLVAAVRTAWSHALDDFALLLNTPTLLPPHRLADALLQGLLALPGPLILALDDYHTITAPPIHALMVRLPPAEPDTVRDTDPGTETTLRGEISLLRAALASAQGSSAATVKLAEAALPALGPDLHFTLGTAQFYYIWGLQACGHYARAVEFAHRQLELHGWQANVVTLRLFLALGTASPGALGYLQTLLGAFGAPSATSPLSANWPVLPPEPPMRQPSPAELFTNREIDVLILLAQRLGDKEIAAQLVLSPLTVKKHTQRLYRKLGVPSRRAAVAEARRLGLI